LGGVGLLKQIIGWRLPSVTISDSNFYFSANTLQFDDINKNVGSELFLGGFGQMSQLPLGRTPQEDGGYGQYNREGGNNLIAVVMKEMPEGHESKAEYTDERALKGGAAFFVSLICGGI